MVVLAQTDFLGKSTELLMYVSSFLKKYFNHKLKKKYSVSNVRLQQT